MDPFGLSIVDVDENRLIMADDTMSQADRLCVDEGNRLEMVDEEEPLGWADNDEGGTGTSETSNKDDAASVLGSKPFEGQLFDNCEDAYAFYNSYALSTGFGIRKGRTNRSIKTGEPIRKSYVCDKEGLRNPNDKRQIGMDVKRRRETREGCEAKMEINLTKEDKWEVRIFVEEHCHDLTSPLKTRLHHSHNTLHKKALCKNLMDKMHSDGFGPSGIARAINASNDGSSSALTPDQVSSHLRAHRANNMGRESATVANQFQQKRAEDPNFQFAMEIDVDGNLRSMFWADSRAREAYLTFSDVIVFYVTYKTNRYRMPFAPFTGVNHHRQSTLFGCALLADETEETFTWLFRQWLKCMFDKAPGCIITDMDGAMRNAIRHVFPNTRHRFCSWHISRHLVEHVPDMRDATSQLYKEYNHWFYRKHKADSEKEWGALVEKYNLDDRHWLCKMWDLRMHWVPAYFRDTFTAGMTSSARSESINAFFDGFVKQSTTLEEFVVQYEKALVARRKKEAEEDWRTKSSHAVLKTKSTLEADAAKCYTRKIFDLFQLQFLASIDCWEYKESENGNVTEYKVRMRNEEEWKSYKVIYDVSEGVNATCECAMFETAGILCKHILRIMDMRRLGSIPQRYLLNRWTIGARYQVNSFASTTIGDGDEVTSFERWCITSRVHKVLDEHPRKKSILKKMEEDLNVWVAECEEAKKDKESVLESSGSQVQSNYPLEIHIHDPQVVRTKGRPKNATRFKSPLEASQSQPKQQRTCKKCGEKGHYATTCKNIPEEEVCF
ncbi:protein FAR1-RELATED SEQUENCE 5-like [Tasmannia lanceolata]|uniref:protein FAR1-RELATED SEQUENCE 5-like n=1 Tax=Tasmannia lanceolata TaxID=3420 RepID=UPI0040633158